MKCPSCQAENLSNSRFCHRCATPLQKEQEGNTQSTRTYQTPTYDLSRGDLFAGRYEVIEELGLGGMGKVFKVFDHKIKEVVALKLIRPEIGVNARAIERFRNELRFARKIAHRNVCRMYDLGEEGFFYFITMEYVAGEDLKSFIRRSGRLTPGKGISIAKQVCEGLAEAHRLGIVHRDLKPQNVMIDREGNAKIMDFGIARFLETEGVTGSGVMIGTPEYMSPEQAELKEVDKRSDIYSLGVILYEMISGKVPFEGETPLSLAMRHKTETPKNVRELNPQISVELASLISKCMAKDRNGRYQSVEDLIADLTRVEQTWSIPEKVIPKKEPISTREITVSFQMKKLFLPILIVLTVILAGVLIWRFIPRERSAPAVDQSLKAEKLPLAGVSTEAKKAMPEKAKGALGPTKTQPGKKDKIEATFKGEQKSLEKANPEEVAKGPQEGSIEAQKLMASDSEKQSAHLSRTRMNAAKLQAQNTGLDERNLLYKLANAGEQDAEKAYAKNDFSEAKPLYNILERVFRLSVQCNKDEDCVKILQELVAELKSKAAKSQTTRDSGLFDAAQKDESQGRAFLTNKEFEDATKSFFQAAFEYEKIRLKPSSKDSN